MKENILNLDETQLSDYLQLLDQPRYRTRQIMKGIYVKNYEEFSRFSDLPKALRAELDTTFLLRSFTLEDQIVSPKDDTTKFLWKLNDGMMIESVIIYEGKRTTFCISSQVGCALDCKFCATGRMGLLRNLTSGEIVEQVLLMKKLSRQPVTNIVFMGMGEPLLNYDAVIRAADLISDPEGLCISRKKITISTSGIVKNIRRLADEQQPYSLAISLNAVDQTTRERIMPIARKYPLGELLEAARYYTRKTGKRITFEYVLMDGLNSGEQDAHRLLKITRGIPSKINIIPCNSDDPLYAPPPDEKVLAFDQIVNGAERTITVRNRKGWDIQAACGQLYAGNRRKSKQKTFIESIPIKQ